MIRKLCCRPGCDELSDDGGPHCPRHKVEAAEKVKASRKRAKANAASKAGAALYNTARWMRMRAAQLNASPLCEDCAGVGLVEVAEDVDHIKPHRGDRVLFFDRKNLQSLCHSCHSRKTAREVFRRPGAVEE